MDPAILDSISAVDPRIRVIPRADRGCGPALLTGPAAATGDGILLGEAESGEPGDRFVPCQ